MIRRPPRSTLFPLHDALPICCFAFWAWLRQGKSIIWLAPGVVSLILFAYLLTLGASQDRKSTRLNSSHVEISYAVFCLKKKTISSKIANVPTRGLRLLGRLGS